MRNQSTTRHDRSTHGIADVISAREAAIVITNKDGMNHPNTIPTCPPEEGDKLTEDTRKLG